MTPALALTLVAVFAAGMAWGIFCERTSHADQSATVARQEAYIAALCRLIDIMSMLNRNPRR